MSPGRRLRRSARPPLRVLRAALLPMVAQYVRSGEQARRRARPSPTERPRLCFLLLDAYSQGGTVRTVLNTVEELRAHYDVEVVSLLRDVERPHFTFPPGVRVRVLDDRTRPSSLVQRCLSRLPSLLWHDVEQAYPQVSLWLDLQLARHLRTLDADIVVGTRHALTILLAALAPDDVITVAQVHLATVQQHPDLRRALCRSSRRLDAVVVLTVDEQRDYEPALRASRTRLVRIPNAVPPLEGGPADSSAKVVVAIGRLRHQKGFDLLVPAFAEVAAVRPDWVLRIYGEGSEHESLERQILARGLSDRIVLAGWSSSPGEELAKASLFALSSRSEGFPMVLLEAMSKGLPVVSFDCPYGPAEIITHGQDGLLVPPEDVEALTAALLTLIDDDDLRSSFGRAARRKAGEYAGPQVAERWRTLYDELLRDRTAARHAPRTVPLTLADQPGRPIAPDL
jgi:glycosyltransferase involved in cell wall biosynthesis